MKVLLATDGSVGAADAAGAACRVLRGEDRQIDLLCVAPEFHPRITGWDESRANKLYRRRILDETRRMLEDARKALSAEGGEIHPRAVIGSPNNVIVRASAEYDLTVLGAQGHGARSEDGLGPVSSHVLNHAEGSILIGRKLRSESGFRVLVSVDGSDAATRAVEAITTLLDLESADVTILHVLETPWVRVGLEPEWQQFQDPVHDQIEPEIEWDRAIRDKARNIVERARDQIKPHHPGVQVTVAEGVPAYEILSEAERLDCDLIVLGATGVSDLKHQLLGSVSHRVAWDAPCSVLIVRS